jgi:hypothetical protein
VAILLIPVFDSVLKGRGFVGCAVTEAKLTAALQAAETLVSKQRAQPQRLKPVPEASWLPQR